MFQQLSTLFLFMPITGLAYIIVGHSEGTTQLNGKTLFTHFSGFTPRTSVFTQYTPTRQGYTHCRKVTTESCQYHLKGNQDGYLKNIIIILKFFGVFSICVVSSFGVKLTIVPTPNPPSP